MNDKTIIVDLGVIPYEMVKDCIETSKYEIIFIGNNFQIEPLRKLGVNNQLVEYNDFVNPVTEHIYPDNIEYSEIFQNIIDNYQTMLIAERCSYRRGYRSNFNDVAKIDIMIENYLNFLYNKNIAFIFYQACPHNINSWVFANVAESLGIKVYMCNSTIFFWRNCLMEGVNSEKIVDLKSGDNTDPNINKYISKMMQRYDNAIPEYEKQRLLRRKGKYWSWRDELVGAVKNYKKMLFLPFKYRLFKEYEKYSKKPCLKDNYIILFLHYQPERTSMPEGRYFTNQWRIINIIHRALPAGYKLYVKEHPSIFTNINYDPRYRDLNFYRNISKLENVILIDSSVDTFSLIDNSVCISTITGTVGGESLFRGKAVLAFGNATYRGHKYVYSIKSELDVKNALDNIRGISSKEISEYTQKVYVSDVLGISISGVDNTIETGEMLVFNKKIRNRSISRILCKLLEE